MTSPTAEMLARIAVDFFMYEHSDDAAEAHQLQALTKKFQAAWNRRTPAPAVPCEAEGAARGDVNQEILAALEDIARQELPQQMSSDEYTDADFESAYVAIVEIARTAFASAKSLSAASAPDAVSHLAKIVSESGPALKDEPVTVYDKDRPGYMPYSIGSPKVLRASEPLTNIWLDKDGKEVPATAPASDPEADRAAVIEALAISWPDWSNGPWTAFSLLDWLRLLPPPIRAALARLLGAK